MDRVIEISINDLKNLNNPIIFPSQTKALVTPNLCPINIADFPELAQLNPLYGIVDKNIGITIMLTQDFSVLGNYKDIDYIPKLFIDNGIEDPMVRLPLYDIFSYLDYGANMITGTTDSKLERFFNYNGGYFIGMNYSATPTKTFDGVLSQSNGVYLYVIGAFLDANGDIVPDTGVYYQTDFNIKPILNEFGEYEVKHETRFMCYSDGRIYEDYALNNIYLTDDSIGNVQDPIYNGSYDLDRGITSINEPHLRLEEIRTASQLEFYQQNYFNYK